MMLASLSKVSMILPPLPVLWMTAGARCVMFTKRESGRKEILPYLCKLHDELRIPMLYVSHSLEEVSFLCDYLLVMEQGRISFKGSINDALVSPQSPLATADNAAALLEGNVSKQEKDFQISTVQEYEK